MVNENILKENPELFELYKNLSNKSQAEFTEFPSAIIFTLLFRELFTKDYPDYLLKSGKMGASRSNWTYHTAVSFLNTAKMMGYTCRFEVEGKRDAIIQTVSQKPETFLYAEWEWNHKDIFGKGKELEKLVKSTNRNKNACAFLLTYVPKKEYISYVELVREFWQNKSKSDGSALIFCSVMVDKNGSELLLNKLRTLIIYRDSIDIWNDEEFV